MSLDPIALQMDNVTVAPPHKAALNGFTAVFVSNQICGLTGPNGAGTSTVAKVLAGDYGKHKGKILVFGAEVPLRNQAEAIDLGIGVVRQELVVIPSFSVFDNLALTMPRMSREAKGETAREIDAVAIRYGIPVRADQSVDAMGAADQQWVDVLRVLYTNPTVVVFDQTEIRLGGEYRDLYVRLLETLRDEGRAVVVISHDPDLLAEVVDETIVVRQGRTAQVLIGSEQPVPAVPIWPERAAEEMAMDHPPLVLSGFGTAMAGRFDLSIASGQVVGVGGHAPLVSTELLEALGGLRSPVGQAHLGERLLDLRSSQSARASGVQYVEPDPELTAPAHRRSISSMLTGSSDSWVGRLFAQSDRKLSTLEALHTLIEVQQMSPSSPISVVIADRPMLGLDDENRQKVGSMLRELANGGALVLFGTDSEREREDWCDQVILIDDPGVWRWG